MTQSDKWAHRPSVDRYFVFANALKASAAEREFVPKDNLCITFHIPMPESWSKKKKVFMLWKPHTQVPDIDNLIKSFLDALLTSDAHISKLCASKIWAPTYGGMIEIEQKEI